MPATLLRLAVFACLALATMSAPASAQTNLTWDVNGAAAGTGGTGTWNTTTPIWFNGTTFVPWTNGGTFGNAIFGGTAGTVTVSGSIDVHNITFNTAGYTVTGGTLNLGGTTPTITGSGTITSVLSGTAGLVKGGTTGTLTLSGANTFTGPLTIRNGVTSPSTGSVILGPTASLATTAITIGNASAGAANGTYAGLQNQANNQLSNAVVTFDGSGLGSRHAYWQLLGTAQSAVGIVDASASGVVENTETQVGIGNSTLTLTGTGTYSFNGFFRDTVGGSGTISLVKNGTGSQTLSGNNISYSGATTINAGTLALSNVTAAYRSATTVNGGAMLAVAGTNNVDYPAGFSLTLNNGATLTKTSSGYTTFNASDVAINGNVTINVTNNGANNQLFIGGPATGLTGSGTINLINTGSATTGLSFRGNGSFSGTMNVSGGVVTIGSLGPGSSPLALQNTDLNLSNGARLNLGGAFAANATSGSVKSLAGNATTTATLGAQTLTLGTNNGTGATFAGVISGTGALVKTGTGTQTLSGANTYTGTTSVNAGTLLVNGSLSTGAVTAASGATLGGSGSIGGPTTIAAGATLAPGASSAATGALSTRALTLNGTSVLAYDMGAANVIGAQNDVTNVTGNLTLDGTINITDAGTFASTPGSYRLFSYTGALTNNTLTVGTTPGYGPGEAVVQTVIPGRVNLVVSSGMNVAFWDGAGAQDDGAIAGGTQTWNNTAGNWTNSTANINQSWLNGMAIFEGTAGTVTLGANVQARALQFSTDGYQITSAVNSITLLALPAGGAPLVRVDPGVTATIGAHLLGSAGLQKADTGRLILTGTAAYTGNTTVAGGTLLVNGSLSASPITTSAGTTLGGTGTIAGAVTIGADGTLAPGASIGTLTVGSLSLSATSLLDYELASPLIVGGTANDLTIVSGNLTLDGTLSVIDAGGFGLGVYTLMTYGGVLVDNGLQLGTLPGGFGYQVQSGAGVVLLIVGALAGDASQSDVLLDPTVFWDGSATSANGVVDGGSGVWTASPANWTRADGSANGRWGGQFAVFQGTAGTVTVEGVVAVTGMQFRTSDYAIVGGTDGTIQINQALSDFRVDDGVTATIAAPIAGPGGLVKRDSGTLILTGGNSYSGGTTILDGTLQGNATSLRGDIRNEASLVFDQRDDARFSGTLSGSGSLTKTGTGTLFLDGTYDVRGLTAVQAGTVALNGSLAGSVSVAPAGTFAARGSVGGSLTVDGTVSTTGAAGSDIAGPLNVAGDVTLNPGARYAVTVGADGRSSQIVAAGAAHVNGATIQVDPLGGQYGRVSHYGVLSASGGITGRAAATSSVSTFDAVATTTSSTLVLTLLRTDIPLAGYSTTPNGAAIGGALDQLRATATGDLAGVTRELTALTDAELDGTLDAISGEIYASQLQLVALDGEGVADLVREELALRQLRGTDDGSRAALGRSWGPAHRGWIRLQGQRADFDGGSVHGGRASLAGVAGAFDWRSGAWLLGVGGAIADGSLTLDGLASKSDLLAPRGFGYVGYTGRGVSVHAGAAVAYVSFETRRSIDFTARLPAQFGGVPLFGGVSRSAIGDSSGIAPEAWSEVRLAVPIASWQLAPSMGLRYAHYGRSAWRETEADALSLRAPDQAVHSTQADGGVRLGRTLGRFRPEFQARYRRELSDGRTTTTLSLTDASSGAFVVDGLVLARDSIIGRAGTSLLLGNVGMSMMYEAGRASGLTRHALQLGVAFD